MGQDMCRLFAFLGTGPERLDAYLTGPAPSLRALSGAHTDGWGIARFDGGRPYVTKMERAAQDDPVFAKCVEGDRAEALIAHIRRASVGGVSHENTHPFHYGPWAFAHNGTIPGAEAARENLLAGIPLEVRNNVKGTTDSELAFHRILGILEERYDTVDVPVAPALRAVGKVFRDFRREHEGSAEELAMNFLLAREEGFIATRLNRSLYARFGEGEFGAFTMLASEPMGLGADGWWEIPEGHLVCVTQPGRLEIMGIP